MRIGIDFDNTIACYDGLFHEAAVERGWMDGSLGTDKQTVRDHLRATGREDAWTELQGFVYGPGIRKARPYPGLLAFLDRCRSEGAAVHVVSHKTKTPYRGPAWDLHEAARDWLRAQHVLDNRIASEDAFFEPTLDAKLRRIAALDCTHFVDDLPELFAESGFPRSVQRILFDPHQRHTGTQSADHVVSTWSALEQWVFERGSP